MNMTCAILAGGSSRRMGRDKAVLRVGRRRLIQHVYDAASRVFSDIIILSNHHSHFEGIDAPVLPDLIPGKGSMVGVVSALLYSATPYVCVLACDMPNVSEDALRYMANAAHGEDVIIPRTALGYEALHAIYNRSCLSYFLTAIERNRLKLQDVLPYLSVREVGDDPVFLHRGLPVFTNINMEEDLLKALVFENGGELLVRRMVKDDLDKIVLIEKESYLSPWTKRLFEEALFSPIGENFVIALGDRVVGYLCLYTVEDEGHILNIAVSSEERNKGFASILMDHVITELGERGITQFYLEVRESNTSALSLYNKFGFVAIGKRRKYYSDTNEDALVMCLAQGNG